MAKPGCGYRYITIDGIAVSKPCNLIGVIFTPLAATDYIAVYDGQDVNSGETVMRLDAVLVDTVRVVVPGGIYCPGGVYVDFSNPGGHCTIVYDTVETV